MNVWTGDELLVIGGFSGDGLATPIAAALDPASGTWCDARSEAAPAWTGRRLIVWSGWAFHRLNPTPADGASLLVEG